MKTFIGISLTIIMFVSTLLTTSFTSEAASTGWINTSKGWTYQFSNGKKAKAEWVKGYWLNSAGYWTYKYRGSWKKNSRGWWYGDTTGWYAKYQWEKIDQNWYFFDKTGYMATGWEKIGKVWYYFDLSTGKMVTGWKKIKDTWYFFNENGAMTTGWKKISGKWYYFYGGGQMMADGWALINHKKYYFEKSGVWHEDHHNWVEVSKTSATCGQNGKLEQKCSICGITKVTTYPATGNHKYDNGVITKEATTTSTGIKTITCTVCGDSYQETIPKIEEEDPYIPDTPVHTHTLETVAAQAPTCTEPGWTEYKKCKTCDHKEGYTEIPATGHTLVHHAANAATCTEDGNVEYWTCSTCNEMLLTNNAFSNEYVASAKINALGHNFAEEVMYRQNATCHRNDMTTDKPINYDKIKDQYMAGYGYSKWKCSRCGKFEFRIDTNKKPIAHNHGDSEPVNIEYDVSDTSSEWNKSKNTYETTFIAPKVLARSEKGREALRRYLEDEFDFGMSKYYGADYTYEEFIKISEDILPIWMIDHKCYTEEDEQQFMNDYDLTTLGNATHTNTVYLYTSSLIYNDKVTYKCQVCGENYTTIESRVVYPANCYRIDGILFSPNGFIVRK